MLVRNSLAHLTARVSSLVAGLAIIPLVSATLGREPLGLVGVYVSLQGMLALFDLGLPIAVNQEISIVSTSSDGRTLRGPLIRTLELPCWMIAGLFMAAGWAANGFLVHSWFNAEHLSDHTLKLALLLIFAAVAIRFPVAFYSNALFGMRRHFYPNMVTSAAAIARVTAALIALVAFDVGIVGFFVIQVAANIAEVTLLAIGAWWREPWLTATPRRHLLHKLTPRIGYFFAISLAGAALAQADKIVLSKILPLSDFGVYAAGYTLAAGLIALSYPVSNAAFPQLTRDATEGKVADVARLLVSAAELTVLVVVPIGAVIVARPDVALKILFVAHAFPKGLGHILPLMMLGGIAQSFVTLPHMFSIAAGRLRQVFWVNFLLIAPFAIAVWIGERSFGIEGAAAAFALMSLARLGAYWASVWTAVEQRRSWLHSAAGVALAVPGCLVAAMVLTSAAWSPAAQIAMFFGSYAALVLGSALSLPTCRERLRHYSPRLL